MDKIQYKLPAPRRSTSPWVEIRQSVPGRVASISPFVDQLMSFIRRFFQGADATNTAADDIEIAVSQALSSAILNRDRDSPENRVSVRCRCTMDGEVRIRVRDKEPRFEAFPAVTTKDVDDLNLDHGCGLHLLKSLMDEVALEEQGKVLIMRKRLRAA